MARPCPPVGGQSPQGPGLDQGDLRNPLGTHQAPAEIARAATDKDVTMLRRIFAYAAKLINLEEALDQMRDSRIRPRIKTRTVVQSALAMFLSRLGSLNALEQTMDGRIWQKLLGTGLPS